MPLQSARFAGDPQLEACLNHLRNLRIGSTGPAVAKIQRALVDLGFPLPRSGVDGKFGIETAGAVKRFQKSKGLIPVDGIVGPDTMRALDASFPAAPGAPLPSALPKGIHWGVDTVNAANSAVLQDGKLVTLFDLITSKLGMPEFWGRYLFASAKVGITALKKEEAKFIFNSSNGTCRILVIDDIGGQRFKQGKDIGRQDAQIALNRCSALSMPGGAMVYADIEPQFECSSGWFQGWWEVMRAGGRGGGGLYCDATQFIFSRPHRAALKATMDPLSAGLNPDPPLFPPDPPFIARLLWAQRPVKFFKTIIDPKNFKPDVYLPAEPTYQRGTTAIWQYAGNCRVPGSGQLIDMNLANDQGFGSMWRGP
jgi:hypothetical protein